MKTLVLHLARLFFCLGALTPTSPEIDFPRETHAPGSFEFHAALSHTDLAFTRPLIPEAFFKFFQQDACSSKNQELRSTLNHSIAFAAIDLANDRPSKRKRPRVRGPPALMTA